MRWNGDEDGFHDWSRRREWHCEELELMGERSCLLKERRNCIGRYLKEFVLFWLVRGGKTDLSLVSHEIIHLVQKVGCEFRLQGSCHWNSLEVQRLIISDDHEDLC